MHKRYGSALRIGLSQTSAAVVRSSGWFQTRSEIIAEWAGADEEYSSPEGVLIKLGALLKEARCSRLPARIVLSDSWARRWMVTPPQNASSLADCQAAAMVRFQMLFGEAMSDWDLAADWDARQPFMACAIPRTLLAGLQQLAREHDLVLLEVAPQFVIAWNRWRTGLQSGAWFGVLHQQMLSFSVLGQNRVLATREVLLPIDAMCEQQRVPEILAREALRLNVPMPNEIRLCGQIPAQWDMQKTGNLSFVRLNRSRSDRSRVAMTPLSAAASLALTGMQS